MTVRAGPRSGGGFLLPASGHPATNPPPASVTPACASP